MEQANFGGINENWIKRKLQIIEIGEKKQVLVKGHSYMSWMKYDESSERLAIAQLYAELFSEIDLFFKQQLLL